jgi:hypothetical protein
VKNRRHHNNKGLRQIKRGKTREQIERIAHKLGIPYAKIIQEPIQETRTRTKSI